MTILKEFGAFESEIKKELEKNLPLLGTTKILMECVKKGMGREVAHELIKKHSVNSADFFESLAAEKDFPLTVDELNALIKNPKDFAGNALNQAEEVKKSISTKIKGKVSSVDLSDLR
jgi:adenylosuccinate lyase